MSPSIRFTRSELWIDNTKYLHEGGVVFKLRAIPKKIPGVHWSVDMWKGPKATAAVQKLFTTAWSEAPVCNSCGVKTTSVRSDCEYCVIANLIRNNKKVEPVTIAEPVAIQEPVTITLGDDTQQISIDKLLVDNDNDDDYDMYLERLDEIASNNNIRYTRWSIGSAKNPTDFSKPHGFTAKMIKNVPLRGDTWLDVWKCIDKAYRNCGDHRFIEDVSQTVDGKYLWVFMGS